MPASAARIGFIQQEFRRVVAVTPDAKTRHGNLARESGDPVETFFDNTADAQLVANERQTLLSAERRRFRATTVGLSEVLALNLTGAVPLAQFTDTELAASRTVVVNEITLDFQNQGAVVGLWG